MQDQINIHPRIIELPLERFAVVTKWRLGLTHLIMYNQPILLLIPASSDWEPQDMLKATVRIEYKNTLVDSVYADQLVYQPNTHGMPVLQHLVDAGVVRIGSWSIVSGYNNYPLGELAEPWHSWYLNHMETYSK